MAPPIEQGMANAFSNVVMGMLLKVLEEKYRLWKGVKEVCESLQKNFEYLDAYMADERNERRDAPRSHREEVLIADVRDLTHDIEDCIELFLHRVTCEEGAPWLSRTAHGAKTFYTRYRFGAKMKKLNKRLEGLKDRSDTIRKLREGGGQSSTSTAAPAGGGQRYPVERNPVGIALAKGELLALLDEVEDQQQQPQRRVISIVGFGGSGKTTLARAVYDSPQAQSPRFCCRAWVDRREYADASGLLKKIIQKVWPEAGQDVLQETNEERLRNHLQGYLGHKRYLIVMDDIDMNLWEWIISTFEDNGASSRIIVTTTIQKTANKCSSSNGYVYKMRTLGDAASKRIALLDTSDFEHSLTLLMKCDGLPLALVSVANHFRSENGRPTGNLCEKLCRRLGSYLHDTANENTNDFARLRGVLMDNYTSLTDYTGPPCLLYLGIFPNDRPLKRNVMIRRWLAEGYARSNDPLERSEQVADKNFEKFINWNIIQPVGISDNEVLKTCKTHGIVHEFVLHKSISEKFIMSTDAFPIDNRHKKVRHLFVNDRNDINSGTTLKMELSRVRSLTVSGNAGGAISNFRKYKLMRVLDLEECRDVNDHHLKDICNLWNLRYLSLGPNITELPRELPREFAKLKLLETLHVSKTSVTMLPVEVIWLPCLTYLIGKFKLPHQDGTVSGDLERLSKDSKLETLAGFVADGSQGFLQLMVHMKKLRKVRMWCEDTGDIINLNNHLVQAIQKYTKAPMGEDRSLSIDLHGASWRSLRELYNYSLSPENKCYLRSLKLHGNVPTLPEFVHLLFCDLTKLCLSLTTVTQDLLSALSKMRRLDYLKLIACQIGEGLVIEVGVFKKLRHLRIVLPGPNPVIPQIQDGALPELVSLQLLCKHLAGLSGIVIRHLNKLKEIELDPGVNDQTRGEWEAAARNHPNRPDVLPFKSVDDPTGNEGIQGQLADEGAEPYAMQTYIEPTENPVIPEEAAPEDGIQGQLVDEGPESYAMQTYIEPTENPVIPEEAAPEDGIQGQLVDEGPEPYAMQTYIEPTENPVVPEEAAPEDGIQGQLVDEGPEPYAMQTYIEPTENPVIPEEAAPEDGIQGQLVDEGPESYAMQTYIEPTENPVIPEEAAPEDGIQGQLVDEGPEPYAMQTYIEPTENPVVPEEAAPEDGIQGQLVDEGPEPYAMQTYIEPTENPVIPEEAAPEDGIQGQLADEGPEPYAMQTYIEPTENPVIPEEAAPEICIQEQPVEGVFAQEKCAVQSSPGDILNSTPNNLGLRGERNDSTDSEPVENLVATEESIHEDVIQERPVEEGPQRSPVRTEQEEFSGDAQYRQRLAAI